MPILRNILVLRGLKTAHQSLACKQRQFLFQGSIVICGPPLIVSGLWRCATVDYKSKFHTTGYGCGSTVAGWKSKKDHRSIKKTWPKGIPAAKKTKPELLLQHDHRCLTSWYHHPHHHHHDPLANTLHCKPRISITITININNIWPRRNQGRA